MFDAVMHARQHRARQQLVGVALHGAGELAGFADAFEFAFGCGLKAAEGEFLNPVGESALKPAAMMVRRALLEVLVP